MSLKINSENSHPQTNALVSHKRKREHPRFSLSTELKRSLPFYDVSFYMSQIATNAINCRNDLVKYLGQKFVCAPYGAFNEWKNFCKQLIELQSSDIGIFAILEMISNAIDAIDRAGKINASVIIEYDHEQSIIRIKDPGDGIAYAQIHNVVVPRSSSNRNEDSKLQQRISMSTGRFGVGGTMAPLYLVLYPFVSTRPPPSFFYEATTLILQETVFFNGQEYLLTAKKAAHSHASIAFEQMNPKCRSGN